MAEKTPISYIDDALYKYSVKASQELEKSIIEFFGSEEKALRYAHLYAIDHYPNEIEYDNEANSVKIESTWVIRLKTAEELERDRNAKSQW